MTEKTLNVGKTLNELADQMDILREMDITKIHFMDENWKPTNRKLSAKKFKRCWTCLAATYVIFYNKHHSEALADIQFDDVDKLYISWLSFLHYVKKAVVQGPECNCIKKPTAVAGISRDVLLKFLDF